MVVSAREQLLPGPSPAGVFELALLLDIAEFFLRKKSLWVCRVTVDSVQHLIRDFELAVLDDYFNWLEPVYVEEYSVVAATYAI